MTILMQAYRQGDVLVHGDKVLALDHKLGHWIFSCLRLPTPQPLPTSVSRGRDWSAGPKGLQIEFGEAVFAGGFIVDVVDDVILSAGHTEEGRTAIRRAV